MKTCPSTCPRCGSDLQSEGYPIVHQNMNTGRTCTYRWNWEKAMQDELDAEMGEQ